jgi:hypothetical protein
MLITISFNKEIKAELKKIMKDAHVSIEKLLKLQKKEKYIYIYIDSSSIEEDSDPFFNVYILSLIATTCSILLLNFRDLCL